MLFVSCEFPSLNPSIFVGELSQKKSDYTPTLIIKFSCNDCRYKIYLQGKIQIPIVIFILHYYFFNMSNMMGFYRYTLDYNLYQIS